MVDFGWIGVNVDNAVTADAIKTKLAQSNECNVIIAGAMYDRIRYNMVDCGWIGVNVDNVVTADAINKKLAQSNECDVIITVAIYYYRFGLNAVRSGRMRTDAVGCSRIRFY